MWKADGKVRRARHDGGVLRNANGHPETLVPGEPGNTRAAKHGVFSADRRLLEPRAREIAERLDAPHANGLDEIGAVEIGRLEVLIEAIDRDLAERA